MHSDTSKMLIRFDWALKRLLRNKADFVVLEGFLSVLLREDVKIISINESESNQKHPNDKYNRVDILVENNHKELLIIEVQTSYEADYYLRMLYGVSKAISEHIVKGDRYYKIRKVYHINIVYFELGEGDDYVYYGCTDFIGLHSGKILSLTKEQKKFFAKRKRKNLKTVKDLYPEYFLLCVEDFDKKATDNLDQWMYYLKNSTIPDDFTASGLPEAREQWRYDNLSAEEKKEYDHHLQQVMYERNAIEDSYFLGQCAGETIGLEKGEAIGLEKGEAIGLEKGEAIGLEKGEYNKAVTIALKMLKKGMSIEDISDMTGLSKHQIEILFKNSSKFS